MRSFGGKTASNILIGSRNEGAVEQPDGAGEIRASSHLPDEQPVFHGGSTGLAPWGNVKTLLSGAIS